MWYLVLSTSCVFPAILAMPRIIYHPPGADSNIWLAAGGRSDAGDDWQMTLPSHYFDTTCRVDGVYVMRRENINICQWAYNWRVMCGKANGMHLCSAFIQSTRHVHTDMPMYQVQMSNSPKPVHFQFTVTSRFLTFLLEKLCKRWLDYRLII